MVVDCTPYKIYVTGIEIIGLLFNYSIKIMHSLLINYNKFSSHVTLSRPLCFTAPSPDSFLSGEGSVPPLQKLKWKMARFGAFRAMSRIPGLVDWNWTVPG